MGGDSFVGQGLPEDADLSPDSPADGEGMPPEGDEPDPEGDFQGDEGAEGGEGDGEGEGEDFSPEGEGDDTGEGASSTPEFDRLLKEKWGGDKEAMARSFLEQANSLSDLAREVRGIREFVQGQQAAAAPRVSKEERKQRIAESPDVVELREEMQSIAEQIEAARGSYTAAVQEVGKQEKTVERLQGRIEMLIEDDPRRTEMQQKLATAEAAHSRAQRQFLESDREIKKLGASYKKTQRQMEKAERAADSEIDKEIKQQRDDALGAQETRADFARAMTGIAKDRNIPVNSPKFKLLFDSIQSRLWAYLSMLPEDADPINVEAAAKILSDQYFKEFGGESFQQQSRRKRGAGGQGNPPSRPSSRPPNKGGRVVQDAAYWDRRAKHLLGG